MNSGLLGNKQSKKKLLEDADELASIIYDIFKENNAGVKIINGQNDAKDSAKF